MKQFLTLKKWMILFICSVCVSFTFAQKYTGLTALASDGTTAATMLDNNFGTRWQDASNKDTAWVVVNLGSVKNVNSIKVYWENANAKAYKISFSTDNVNFVNELSYTNMAANNRTDIISGLNVDCQYIKMQGVTRQLPYGYSIYEFEVYPAYTPVLTSLSLTPATSTAQIGVSKQLTVNGLDQLGNAITLTNATTWSVDGSGATVDATGLFTGFSKGLYTITATNSGISKTATVEILPVEPNISIVSGVVASASSGTASAAIDNNNGTRWESLFTDPQWIMVDLGLKKHITDMIISWEAANAKDYIIEVSNNGTDWTTIVTKTAMASGSRTDRLYDINVDAQYVRLTGTARNLAYGYSIWEFKIFGNDSVATALNDVYQQSALVLYPNPASEKVILATEIRKASFYTLQGQLKTTISNQSVVLLDNFAKGVYLVKTTDLHGNIQSTKLEIR